MNLKIGKINEDLIQQQDLYGAPPIQALYGVPSPRVQNFIETPALYGPPPGKTNNNNVAKVAAGGTGVFFSMLLFIVGLIAMFNKKIPTFVKVILGICVIVAIILIVLLTVFMIGIL